MSDEDHDTYESDADRRAHHNALERKRRDNLKDNFALLRDALPVFKGDKVRASRAQILKKAADHIVNMKKRNAAHVQDVNELRRQSEALDEQIRLLQQSKSPENMASSSVVSESVKTMLKNINFQGFKYADTSDSEDSTDDSDSNDNSKK